MVFPQRVFRAFFAIAVLSCSYVAHTALADSPEASGDQPFDEQVYLVLRTESLPVASRPVAATHPLLPVLKYAHEIHQRLDKNVTGYECVLTKRERIEGTLRPHEVMRMKLRHRHLNAAGELDVPLSMYVNFLSPGRIKGREVLYVEGANDGDLIATRGGNGNLSTITLSLDPESDRVMRDSRYPVTDAGMLNLAGRLLKEGAKYAVADKQNECQVRDIPGAKINGRGCRYIEVKFPTKREGFRFHMAQIFVDDETELPIRFASYDWPAAGETTPILLEEYTYTDVELNPKFADNTFDRENPGYKFYVSKNDQDEVEKVKHEDADDDDEAVSVGTEE